MHLEGVIKGGAGGGKKMPKCSLLSSARMSFFTILKSAHTTVQLGFSSS